LLLAPYVVCHVPRCWHRMLCVTCHVPHLVLAPYLMCHAPYLMCHVHLMSCVRPYLMCHVPHLILCVTYLILSYVSRTSSYLMCHVPHLRRTYGQILWCGSAKVSKCVRAAHQCRLPHTATHCCWHLIFCVYWCMRLLARRYMVGCCVSFCGCCVCARAERRGGLDSRHISMCHMPVTYACVTCVTCVTCPCVTCLGVNALKCLMSDGCVSQV